MSSQAWRSRFTTAVSDMLRQFWASETAVMTTLALVVGLGAGLAATVLIWLISTLTSLATHGGGWTHDVNRGFLVLLPAIGGALAGLLRQLTRAGQGGFDISDVAAAIATRHGHIHPPAALARALASAITIGSGGSAGREGAILHAGAAIGSAVGQALRLNDRRTVTLLAAGAAGGLAATFGAPLAGIMFGLEVVVVGFGLQAFGALVVASAVATVVSRSLISQTPAFSVPIYDPGSPWELLLYAGLGLAAVVAARLFVSLLMGVERTLTGWRVPDTARLALAGLAVGLLGSMAPAVLGMGFPVIEDALRGNLAFAALLVLALLKTLATALTVGSGAAGGVFAPLLFVGATVGAAYGQAAHALFPAIANNGAQYAIVGMAALLAATVRAPVTAVLLVFEMGQDHRIAPALLLATAVSMICAHLLDPDSIYTLQLKKRGIEIRPQRDANLLRDVLVEDAMTPAQGLENVAPDTNLASLARLFQETGHHGVVVLDSAGELYGIVTLADLERAIATRTTAATAADICTRNVVTVFPDETLDDALRHFAALDVGRLPVVARDDKNRLIGILRRSGIVRAYAQALARTPDDEEQLVRARLQAAVGAELAEFVLSAHDAAVGRRLRDIGLPADCVVVSIHRRGRVVVPRGNVQLAEGDRLIVLKVSTSNEDLRRILRNAAPAPSAETHAADAPAAVPEVTKNHD